MLTWKRIVALLKGTWSDGWNVHRWACVIFLTLLGLLLFSQCAAVPVQTTPWPYTAEQTTCTRAEYHAYVEWAKELQGPNRRDWSIEIEAERVRLFDLLTN